MGLTNLMEFKKEERRMSDPNERLVMCVGNWPEDNYTDFIVFAVKDGESDQDALKRAAIAYGEDNDFYIKNT